MCPLVKKKKNIEETGKVAVLLFVNTRNGWSEWSCKNIIKSGASAESCKKTGGRQDSVNETNKGKSIISSLFPLH